MDAVRYLKERMRMCHSFGNTSCGGCPIYAERGILTCTQFQNIFPKQIVEIVKKWSAEQPKKTLLQDFLEKYPKAELIHNKFPEICPYSLGYAENSQCVLDTEERFCSEECEECWNRPLEEE